jgi:hypothetical protein
MGKKWWNYIYIWLVAIASEEKCPTQEEGESNCKKSTKYLLGGLEWQRRVAVFLQESYGCILGGKSL